MFQLFRRVCSFDLHDLNYTVPEINAFEKLQPKANRLQKKAERSFLRLQRKRDFRKTIQRIVLNLQQEQLVPDRLSASYLYIIVAKCVLSTPYLEQSFASAMLGRKEFGVYLKMRGDFLPLQCPESIPDPEMRVLVTGDTAIRASLFALALIMKRHCWFLKKVPTENIVTKMANQLAANPTLNILHHYRQKEVTTTTVFPELA